MGLGRIRKRTNGGRAEREIGNMRHGDGKGGGGYGGLLFLKCVSERLLNAQSRILTALSSN